MDGSGAAVALASIALVGSVLSLVVRPLFGLLRENTTATRALVKETQKGNIEAKTRNGHLGEQNVKIAELIRETRKDVLGAVQNVKTQHVHEQHIEKSEVADEHVSSKE